MAIRFRFALKSDEAFGAGQPNIAYVDLASEADAILFAGNLETAFSADVVTVDHELATNYALPYPVGTNNEIRVVLRDVNGVVQTERLYDIAAATTLAALQAAFTEANLLVYPSGLVVASAQVAQFSPGVSV